MIQITLNQDTLVFGQFVQDAAPPPPVFVGAIVVANDNQYLGRINSNPLDADSLANPFGNYGNEFSSLSIWNSFGQYGSGYGLNSPYNQFTTTPPRIILNNSFYAYLTKNTFVTPRIDPDDLARLIGRPEVARD